MTDLLIMKAIQAKLASSGLDWVKLQSFRLSSKEKKVNAEITLEGEDHPIFVEAHYRITDDNTIVVDEVLTSRKWITEALKLALAKMGGSFPLPSGLKGKLVKVLL